MRGSSALYGFAIAASLFSSGLTKQCRLVSRLSSSSTTETVPATLDSTTVSSADSTTVSSATSTDSETTTTTTTAVVISPPTDTALPETTTEPAQQSESSTEQPTPDSTAETSTTETSAVTSAAASSTSDTAATSTIETAPGNADTTTETTSTTDTPPLITPTSETTTDATTTTTTEVTSTTSQLPVLATFSARGAQSAGINLSGVILKYSTSTAGTGTRLAFLQIISAGGYQNAALMLEETTNRLMLTNGWYIGLKPNYGGMVFSFSPSQLVNAGNLISCTPPIIQGQNLQCIAEGTARSRFGVSGSSGGLYLVNPSSSGSVLTIDVVADVPV